MHEREHKESTPSCGESKLFLCFKYRLMSFKEEPQKEKLSLPLFFFWKIINFCDLCEKVFN